MSKKNAAFYLLLFLCVLNSCTKQVDNTAVPATPAVKRDSASPSIKFFNVVDQGRLRVKLNGAIVADSLAQYFPSLYITANTDSNNIQLVRETSLDTTVFSINVALTPARKYSCFIYKLGFDWKISLVPDYLNVPDSGYAAIRILDFRTQAATNYVNINLFSLGYFNYNGVLPFIYRHFLDHTSFDYLTSFIPVLARPDYKIIVYNGNANLAQRSGIPLYSKKIYSMILMTPATATGDSAAMQKIFPDIEEHY